MKGTELGFYASPSYLARRGTPRSVGAAEHDWLLVGPLRRALELPKGLTARVVANDFLFVREVARMGGGVAVMPPFIARPAVIGGELVRVLPPMRIAGGQLLLVYSATKPLARKVAAFRDFMVQAVATEWVE